MSFDKERAKKIVNDMAEVLGPASVIEYCGNMSYFMSELLRANGSCPADLAEQLALQTFFMDVTAKVFDVDEEILDLEVQKCYINMEKIVKNAKDQNPAPAPVQSADGGGTSGSSPVVASMLEPIGGVEEMLNGLSKTLGGGESQPHVTVDVVPGGGVYEGPNPAVCVPPNVMAEVTDESGNKIMADTGVSLEAAVEEVPSSESAGDE